MNRMRFEKILFSLLSSTFLIIGLSGCDGSSLATTNYSDQYVSDYYNNQMQLAEKNVPELMNRYEQVIKSIKNLEYTELDTTNKLIVDVPAFGGYSDSCRYNPDALVTYFTLYDLDTTAQNPLGDMFISMGSELRMLLKVAKDITSVQQKHFTGSNKSKVTKINKELHNLKVLWESKYLFVLEIDEYQKVPYQPYSKSPKGSSIKANWHVFDFSSVSYLGSIPFDMNNDGFQSDITKTTTTEKTINTRRMLPVPSSNGNPNYISQTETVTETTERSLSYKDKVNQADYNFKEKYTEAARNAVKKYLLNSNEKFRNLVTLK